MTIDFAKSRVTIRTKATGLLAKLAHDLEIDARDFSGTAAREGGAWRAEMKFPAAGLRVAGVVRGGRVDRAVLSSSDVAEIEKRIRQELRGDVTVKGSGDTKSGELTVTTARGEQRVRVTPDLEEKEGDTVGSLRARVSLARLGIGEVKGPLGAFKVDDEVEVAVWLVVHSQDEAS